MCVSFWRYLNKGHMGETFTCYLCKSKEHIIIARKEEIRFGCYGFQKQVIRCAQCGLVQLYPFWTTEELHDLYSRYSQKVDFPGYKAKESFIPYLGKRYFKKSDFVLEIGCGPGDTLKRLRKTGYNIIGIDKDPTVCDGEAVLNYDYKDFILHKGKFDFIYAIHVFEHIPDPCKFIEWISEKLKEKKRFLLEVPSVDDPLLKIYKVERFNDFYWYPYHSFFYNKDSLEKIFRKCPGVRIKIRPFQRYGLINHLRWLFLKRPGNFNPNIPILDNIYKLILTRLLKASDALIVTGEKI